MCRAMGGTLQWLLGFLVQCFVALSDHLHAQPIICHGSIMMRRLEVEAEEMSSFMPKKANKQFGISRPIQHDAGFVADGDFSAAFGSRSSTGNCAFRRQDNVSVDVYESATTQRQARV